MKCIGCTVTVTHDGHGELVHVIPVAGVESYKYGCDPKTKGNDYPVAS